MKVMVLCAGLGTRLRPLTYKVPKPLVPAPEKPLVFHTMERLADAGADMFVVNLHHLPEVVGETIGDSFRGIPVHYSLEAPEILGPTGGPRKVVDMFGEEPFLVVNGDVYFEMDFRALMDFHINREAAVTMAVKADIPDSRLNAVGFDTTLRVRQLWGKPIWNGEALNVGVNIGAFVYSPEVIRRFVPADIAYGFREDFIPSLFEADATVAAFPCWGYWCDVGDEKAYLGFLKDILSGNVPGIAGGHYVSPDAVIEPGSMVVPPCHIAKGCVVSAGAAVGPFTVAGENSIVGKGARLTGCFLAPRTETPADYICENGIIV